VRAAYQMAWVVWLAAGGHVRVSGGCDRQPAPGCAGVAALARVTEGLPGGSGPQGPVVRQPTGNHDPVAAGLVRRA